MMNRAIFIILFFVSTIANAWNQKDSDEVNSIKHEKGWKQTCGLIGFSARKTMESRQAGVSMADQLRITDKFLKPDDPAGKLEQKIVLDAYKQPRFEVEENQQKSVEDFRDKWYLACAENYLK